MTLTLLLITLLLVVNGLCVAAEYSVVSARVSRIRLLADGGQRQAKRLLAVLESADRKDGYISGCQLGITVTSLGVGALCETALAGHLSGLLVEFGSFADAAAHTLATSLVLVVFSFIQVAVSEVLPKAIALQFPNRTAMATAPFIHFFLRALALPLRLFVATTNALLRLFRLPTPTHGHVHTANEIELLIDESRRGGVLGTSHAERLQQALQLQDRQVRRLMVPRKDVFAVDLEQPIETVVGAIMGSDYTRVPVFKGRVDDFVGSIHTKDLVLRHIERGGVDQLDDLIRPVHVVPDTAVADRVLAQLRQRRLAQAVVVDEFGALVGLVTLEDVLADVLGAAGVGAETYPERLADGRLRLPGTMRLEQAAAWTDLEWRGQANTVGGYVVERLGRMPERGERIEIDGASVEIENVARNVITAVRVQLPSPSPDSGTGGAHG